MRHADFCRLILFQASQVQIDAPLRQRDLHDLVAQFGEIDLRIVRQINRIRADAHFGTGLRVGHQPSAGGNRQIDLGCRPIGVAGSVKGKGAGDKAHPSNTSGGIGPGEGGNSEEQD
jgi:hypothetical protein